MKSFIRAKATQIQIDEDGCTEEVIANSVAFSR
jgi:hypothetical protein